MRRAHCLPVIALTAAAIGALVAIAREPSSGPSWTEIRSIAADIERGLGESSAGVSARAAALAALPRLALAVATDRQTVVDLTDGELALQSLPDETIELAQVPRAGGPPVSLRRFPAGPPVAVPLARAGLHLVGGPTPRVASVVRFRPGARADELDGVVAVSWPAGLERATARLAAIGSGVALETASGAIALGGPLDTARGTVEMRIGGAAQPMRLIAPAPGVLAWQRGPLSAAAGIALGAFAACVLICRAASASRSRDPAAWSRSWTPPPAPSPYPPVRPTSHPGAARRLPLPPPD